MFPKSCRRVLVSERTSGSGRVLLASFEIDVLVGQLPIDWQLPRAHSTSISKTTLGPQTVIQSFKFTSCQVTSAAPAVSPNGKPTGSESLRVLSDHSQWPGPHSADCSPRKNHFSNLHIPGLNQPHPGSVQHSSHIFRTQHTTPAIYF